MRELAELQTNPPEGIRVATSEDNMLDVTGIIQGPGACPASALLRLVVLMTVASRMVRLQRARRTLVATSG